MNRRLAVLAPVALATAVLASPSTAAGACLQIVDDSGDGMTLGIPHSLDSLDILSGDIATGKKNLVAVLRLKSAAPDPALLGGLNYTFAFTAGGTPHQLVYRLYQNKENEAELTIGAGTGAVVTAVTAVTDLSTSSVTWTVPRKLVPALKKPGAKFTGLGAGSHVANNVKGPTGTTKGSFSADRASGAKPYTDMAPTCLRGV